MYVVIRRYNHDDGLEILNSRYFGDQDAFETFTVIACIEDFEKLFEIIDNFGVNKRIPAARLMSELYDLCRKVNPMLTYENAQRTEDSDFISDVISDIGDADMSYPPRDQRNRRMQSAASRRGGQKKENKPSFKDVSRKELLTLNDRIKRFIVGQSPAVETIVEAIQRASVGLREPHQPIGTFLMTGPTGIGKTETAKILAQELVKSRTGLIKIDCSEYSSDHEYAKLIGAPAGYIGHDEGGVLTNAIRKNPFSIVVFDEIEKASAKVYDLMLQIMDEGLLTDGKGVPSSFKDTVILMTSNIGVKEIAKVGKKIGFGDVAVLTDDKRIKALEVALKKKFRPEFLNRIDEVVHFGPLDKESYLRIVDLELKKILDRLKKSEKITVTYDKKVKNFIYKHGVDEKFGARPLKRCIKKKFSNSLTRYILNDEINKGDFVVATVKNRVIDFSVSKKAEGFDDPPFYLSKKTATEE
jgi:ATP-dependent Clp protease ATP-binding subunit ClpA